MQDDFVTVAAYPQALAAEAAKNFLEAQGVRAFVIDENVAATTWTNLTETKLQVASADVDLAKKLLVKHHAGKDLVEESDSE